jgi:hypothetical protein|tara:strand:- start:2450 stop:3196 length:747 start_codon:yes stop_codon:yes gene_type:complete
MSITFENEYGKVDFDLSTISNIKRLSVTLSAGTDSSLVMYMLCQYIMKNNLDIEILPFTGLDTKRLATEWYARDISSLFQDMFPKIKFLPHHTFQYEHRPGKTMDKRMAHAKEEWRLYKEEDIKVFCCGKSANPPEDIAKKIGMFDDREKERDIENKTDIRGGIKNKLQRVIYKGEKNRWIYRPLMFVNKKFIAQCYKDYNLMDKLYPLTASCIGYADTTNYFTEPCKTCWWCKEKLWAFGSYDGGVV